MAAPSDADLLVQMQKRLESVTAAKEANAVRAFNMSMNVSML
jgi:hypothetical protein